MGKEWWEAGLMPEGHECCAGVTDYWDHIRHEVSADELAGDQERLSILNPDGTREACPATHAAWSVYIDLLPIKWPSDDGRGELPRPVVVIDLSEFR